MMNPEIKAQWLSALRSGEYEQGRGQLKNDGKYCCLGVLCDLAEKAGVVRSELELATGDTAFGADDEFRDGNPSSSALPQSVQEWAGLHAEVPSVVFADDYEPLPYLNDSCGLNFTRLADLIEESL